MEHQIELLTTQCDIPMYVCNKCGSSFLADEMSFDEDKESDECIYCAVDKTAYKNSHWILGWQRVNLELYNKIARLKRERNGK
jgi:hypothetical protein